MSARPAPGWRGRARDPRQARFLTWASLRWIVRHRAWTPWYLVRYWRFFLLRLRGPHIVTEGLVFLGRGARVEARRGYGRIVLGPWVHLGDGTCVRCHEGTLRIGAKAVLGANNVVNCYLDIELGAASLLSDWIYVCDFDHVFADRKRPVKDQGIAKSPVRIGPGGWIGTKATVTRGVTVGQGAVVGANAVVTHDVPDFGVVGGVPARLLRRAGDDAQEDEAPPLGPTDGGAVV